MDDGSTQKGTLTPETRVCILSPVCDMFKAHTFCARVRIYDVNFVTSPVHEGQEALSTDLCE